MISISLMETENPDWKRMWKPPKRSWKGATIQSLTPQGEYLKEKSLKRFNIRNDVETIELVPEIGRYESFRMIVSDIRGV